jgi:hypothetical protein
MSTSMSTRIAAGVTATYLHDISRRPAPAGRSHRGRPARRGGGVLRERPRRAVIGDGGPGARRPR